MSVEKDEFRSALARFGSGVTVVTSVAADGRRHGITVSAFSSVSLEPPLILICVQKSAGSHGAILECGAFAVHFLETGQEEFSNLFASRSEEKFEVESWSEGISGVPVCANVLAVLECRLHAAHDAGDHTIFIGLVEKTTVRDGEPLIYWKGRYRQLRTDAVE